jgi:hypothetical protein
LVKHFAASTGDEALRQLIIVAKNLVVYVLRGRFKLVADSCEDGKALQRSTSFGIDDTIDPADTRYWLSTLLVSVRPPVPREGKKQAMVDAW